MGRPALYTVSGLFIKSYLPQIANADEDTLTSTWQSFTVGSSFTVIYNIQAYKAYKVYTNPTSCRLTLMIMIETDGHTYIYQNRKASFVDVG